MFVTIRPEDFAPGAGPFDAILDRCGAPIAEVRDHLDHCHGALLGLVLDTGVIPASDQLRATRDIGPIQRALADLETLELLESSAHGLLLPDAVERCLTRALIAHWEALEARTVAALDAAEETKARTTPDALVWLRRLLIFSAHRGLRQTESGELHQGDVRRYEAAVELPSRRMLESCAALGVGLEVFLDLGGKLIVGPGVDVVDLPNEHFVREADHAWADGRLDLALRPTTSAAGLLGFWRDPLTTQSGAESARGSSLYGAGIRAAHAIPRLLGPVSPDPASSVLAASKFDMRGVPAAVTAYHERVRVAVLAVLDTLPRDAALLQESVEGLLRARLARLALEHPVFAPRKSRAPAARVFAAGLTPLPWFEVRAREALPELLRSLRTIHGGCALDDAAVVMTAAVTPAAATGRLTVQPSGEVLAPPDASIHALVHLSCGARPGRLDTVSTFSLDRRALMRLADAGMDVTQWGQLLEQWTGVPLPPTVAELLGDVARRHGELRISPAGAVLVANDAVRMAELLSYPKLAREVLVRASDTVVVLKVGADLPSLLEDLGDRGFSAIVQDSLD
jgi:hypothetical protein